MMTAERRRGGSTVGDRTLHESNCMRTTGIEWNHAHVKDSRDGTNFLSYSHVVDSSNTDETKSINDFFCS